MDIDKVLKKRIDHVIKMIKNELWIYDGWCKAIHTVLDKIEFVNSVLDGKVNYDGNVFLELDEMLLTDVVQSCMYLEDKADMKTLTGSWNELQDNLANDKSNRRYYTEFLKTYLLLVNKVIIRMGKRFADKVIPLQ
ncbi:MAG: hypothetical protein WED05_02630 [Candidatus Atabeyarchaeum deiterrae]